MLNRLTQSISRSKNVVQQQINYNSSSRSISGSGSTLTKRIISNIKSSFSYSSSTTSNNQSNNSNNSNNSEDKDEKYINKNEDKINDKEKLKNIIINDEKNNINNNNEIVSNSSSLSSGLVGFIDKIKTMSVELGKQSKYGIINYYNNYRYIRDVIRPKQKQQHPLSRQDLIHLDTFKRDTKYLIPLSIYLAIPFSTFGLPLYIKYLSFILPSTFSTRDMVIERNLKSIDHRYKIALKFYKSLDLQKNQSSSSSSSNDKDDIGGEIDIIKKENNDNNNDDIIQLESINRSQLIYLSKCIGLKFGYLNTTSGLVSRIKEWEKTVIHDNKMILREGIQTLSLEDLQDIAYDRGIHFKNKSYDQLLNILSKSLTISSARPSHSSYSLSVISNLINTKD